MTKDTSDVVRRQGFVFELMPNGAQVVRMRKTVGACRFVFNKALELQQQRRAQGEKWLTYFSLSAILTKWRNSVETPWLKEPASDPLHQALRDLDRAYANFFAKRSSFPQFRKKGHTETFRVRSVRDAHVDEVNGRIYLPKLGWMGYRNSRRISGSIKNATVSLRNGKWFVSIQTELQIHQAPALGSDIGIDLGIARFATMSDGAVIEPLNSLKTNQHRLRKAQQSLSRKVRHSKNWRKAKARLQRVYSRIRCARTDFLHKLTTTISKNHAVVYIEELRVKNMSASAAGTAENPGSNVRAKSGLNRAILDQGWAEFRRQLDYKLDWAGGALVAVPAAYTSTTCLDCGHVSSENRKTQAEFACVSCGFSENADLVGAMNILRAGRARSACEVSGTLSRQQQEPFEGASL